jgi:hypothetical protein
MEGLGCVYAVQGQGAARDLAKIRSIGLALGWNLRVYGGIDRVRDGLFAF